jgi:hypothetical protein
LNIYLLIASGEIYVDLGAAAMVNQSGFASLPIRTPPLAHQHACPDLRRSVGTSGNATSLVQAHGEAFRLLTAASEQELKVANERFDLVKRYLDGELAPAAVPARTLRSRGSDHCPTWRHIRSCGCFLMGDDPAQAERGIGMRNRPFPVVFCQRYVRA